jgi:hypothetical protein
MVLYISHAVYAVFDIPQISNILTAWTVSPALYRASWINSIPCGARLWQEIIYILELNLRCSIISFKIKRIWVLLQSLVNESLV